MVVKVHPLCQQFFMYPMDSRSVTLIELCPNDGAPSLELFRARLDGILSNLRSIGGHFWLL